MFMLANPIIAGNLEVVFWTLNILGHTALFDEPAPCGEGEADESAKAAPQARRLVQHVAIRPLTVYLSFMSLLSLRERVMQYFSSKQTDANLAKDIDDAAELMAAEPPERPLKAEYKKELPIAVPVAAGTKGEVHVGAAKPIRKKKFEELRQDHPQLSLFEITKDHSKRGEAWCVADVKTTTLMEVLGEGDQTKDPLCKKFKALDRKAKVAQVERMFDFIEAIVPVFKEFNDSILHIEACKFGTSALVPVFLRRIGKAVERIARPVVARVIDQNGNKIEGVLLSEMERFKLAFLVSLRQGMKAKVIKQFERPIFGPEMWKNMNLAVATHPGILAKHVGGIYYGSQTFLSAELRAHGGEGTTQVDLASQSSQEGIFDEFQEYTRREVGRFKVDSGKGDGTQMHMPPEDVDLLEWVNGAMAIYPNVCEVCLSANSWLASSGPVERDFSTARDAIDDSQMAMTEENQAAHSFVYQNREELYKILVESGGKKLLP
jgi:hypothetical protein